MQEDLQKLPPGFPRGVVPQPPFTPLAPTIAQMHTLMPAQSLQPTQQLEYKVHSVGLVHLWGDSFGVKIRKIVKHVKHPSIASVLHLQSQIFIPSGAVLAAATYPAAA